MSSKLLVQPSSGVGHAGPEWQSVLSFPDAMFGIDWMAGLAGLFTRDFFEMAKQRLKPNGIFAQWFHTYQSDWEVFALFELEGLTGEEIAERIGCKVDTVWTRLYYARKEFAKLAERRGLGADEAGVSP